MRFLVPAGVGPAGVGPGGVRAGERATRLPVLTMVLAYSRWLSAVLVPSRHAQDLFAGWWQLIARLGGVPRALVWDGEGANRPLAGGEAGADGGVPGVPGDAGHAGGGLPPGRP